ncbi:MAG TPA: hypothetical protein PLV59_01110 [Candidatus Dojkabacteria bacterium]|nr:hypothetical protein [Candidatus Dojkabacteria bacterium]
MMSFLEICSLFEKLENTSSRNDMVDILVEATRGMTSYELQVFSYLVQGRLAPMFVSAEFNLSEKGLLNALSREYGDEVFDLRKKEGDLGIVAEKLSLKTQKGLLLDFVYDELWRIVNTKGSGSVEFKYSAFIALIRQSSFLEARYLTRIILGKLRLGCSVKTLLDAFSVRISGDKSVRDLLDLAYGASADIGYISQIVAGDNPLEGLKRVTPLPGVPVLSRLVERVKTFEEVGERFKSEFAVQPKYDGLRCQIHKISSKSHTLDERVWHGRLKSAEIDMFGVVKEDVKLFTRNLEDITEMFPEIVESVRKLPVDSAILDSEIVGWDGSKFLSYQDTMTRRRKYGVEEQKSGVPVNAFVFDLMQLNGGSYLQSTTKDRFEMLGTVVKEGLDIQLSPCDFISSVSELKDLFNKYVDLGLEGVIVKDSLSTYIPGVRNFEWIKIKKSIDSDLVDTVDLVVLGYYLGSGKRSKFGIGAILGGVYNPEFERYESVTKIGTGITDEQWGGIKERLDGVGVDSVPKNVVIEKVLDPDVYVSPEVVITVDADEVSVNRSSEGVAKGLSLRFPRLVEFDRDKNPEDSTTVDELYALLPSRE